MKTIISTPKAPAAIGPYSQAVLVNGMLFTSGVIPIDPETNTLVEGDVEVQAKQAIGNLKNLNGFPRIHGTVAKIKLCQTSLL